LSAVVLCKMTVEVAQSSSYIVGDISPTILIW